MITGYTTSGVKLAGQVYRLFYGKSELHFVLKNREKKQTSKDVDERWRGRLRLSGIEVLHNEGWSVGLSMLIFKIIYNRKRDD
jgi:hypothetical protein